MNPLKTDIPRRMIHEILLNSNANDELKTAIRFTISETYKFMETNLKSSKQGKPTTIIIPNTLVMGQISRVASCHSHL